MTAAVRGVIKDICPGGLAEMTGLPEKLFALNPLPSAKICNQFKENWSGNDVDSRTALQGAETVEEVYSAVWSRIYAGLKGDLGPFGSPVRPSNAFNKFMRGDGRHPGYRPDGRRLCDLNDMVLIFRDILKRNPEARKAAQDMFDHVFVDEALRLERRAARHLRDDDRTGTAWFGQGFWVVGDDKQAIYQFRGARPGLFMALNGKENWTTRLIKTNYRCDPEIVEAANKVTAHNEGQIPMVAQADPKKSRGKASILRCGAPELCGHRWGRHRVLRKEEGR